jgi:hypothetical protein
MSDEEKVEAPEQEPNVAAQPVEQFVEQSEEPKDE